MALTSIITPSYNSKSHITAAIESVIAQTYQNWEMIIVDDHSQDSTVEIIKKYQKNDARIKLFRLQENVGAAEARNIGLRKAGGRFIAFLDSDDLWRPDKLEKQLAFMTKNNIEFSFTSYDRITENGNYINTVKVPKVITYKKFLKNTIIGTLTVMLNKEIIGKIEMPNIPTSHDMALWCNLLKSGFSAYGMQENLAKYRVVANSNTAKKWKAALDVWRIYRDHEKLSFIESGYNFIFYSINAVLKRI